MSEKEKTEANSQIINLLDIFSDAKEYGALIEVDEYDWPMLSAFIKQQDFVGQLSFDAIGVDYTKECLNKLISIAKILSSRYMVVATNPPYMASSNANNKLNRFLRNHYMEGKSDLFAAFMQKICSLTNQYGISSMITQHAWMFLSGYFDLRKILYRGDIVNMLHLGSRAFDEIGGEVVQTAAFSWRNSNVADYVATYKNLTKGKNEYEKRELFLLDNICYCKKESFDYYPGKILAYWLNERVGVLFKEEIPLGKIATPRQGLSTSDNDRFLRLWFEVDFNKIGFGLKSREVSKESHKKWFPYNKGGKYRKWYGNRDYVINWENDGEELRNWADWLNTHRTPMGRLVSKEFYFRDSLTWSKVSTTGFAVRFLEQGFLFDVSGTSIFVDKKYKKYLLGALNSCINIPLIKSISPTMNFESGQIANFPVVYSDEKIPEINMLVGDNINIMKCDWDIEETSWDYEYNSLLEGDNKGCLIADKYKRWESECELRFQQLKKNEEELNKIFIAIYRLQGELSPIVKDKDITLRKAELQRDIKSLLSYAFII